MLLHSDGAIASFVPDFFEMGIDALNPVQLSAAGMNSRELKRAFGQDIAFWGGGCSSQVVLPSRKPEAVAGEAKRRPDDLAPDGGFVFDPIHNVGTEVNPENIDFLSTVQEHGVYHN
jgi:uroporphyrinogen decarboxylase